MISQDKISEIRNRASIVEIIGDHVTLKKSGRNYLGLCPFHGEKTPSFTVSEEKGIYHCFGCHAGGSVFHFLMQYDHLTFPEAVERVARRYGIAIDRGDRERERQATGERERLYAINERVAAHYQKILASHREGQAAREYLKKRGVDEGAARHFMLGYAPRAGAGLVAAVDKGRLEAQDALRLGLIGHRRPGQYHERFFGRLMFPILNPAGKVVAFGGRVLDDALPKYLNSSETPLFHKGSTLYGLYQAKDAIRRADLVVLVEGYLDVIALAQFEIGYAVATLGTALSAEHVRLLSRYTKNIVALFDGDEAGQKAAARSFEIFIEAGSLGRAAFLPRGEDPDSFVRRRGKAALEDVLQKAVPLADYYCDWLEARHGTTLEGLSQIAREMSRVLGKVSNPLEADLLVSRAVDKLGIREEVLRQNSAWRPGKREMPPGVVPGSDHNDERAERSLVSAMLRLPAMIERVARDTEARSALGPKWRPAVDGIVAEWQEQKNIDFSRMSQQWPAELAGDLAALFLEGDRLTESECVKIAEDCLAHLRRKNFKARERFLRLAIRAAEEQRDEKAKRERILEWQDLVRKKRQLERSNLEPKATPR